MSQPHAESRTLIAEDLLLLLMDDEKGRLAAASYAQPLFGGALLAELALDGAVEVEEKRGMWHTAKVHAVHPPAGGAAPDPLLARAWEVVAEKPRTAQGLVDRLGRGVRKELQDRLVARGILERRETKILGLFPSTTWPAVDVQHEQQVRASLRDCLVIGLMPTPRTAALVALLAAVDQAYKVLAPGDLTSQRGELSPREVKRRAKAITEGDWAAKAVRDAVAASQAAISTAVMVSTTTAATST
ncbi:GOLPH3/VPS74 family protein [Nocardioides daphniae]|uniref:GPP34 family phosphoprotein n=1 Tax=Nocardioides daphniae TaxID=402297 RepID=A0A4P7UBV6_9ACTN|nr:GPP34 family phosphoprotein [Nocardioides daphniae]QCC76795.1 GPP34 family phosphoprotein [Nocardioides daphniae]GGD16561.1 hypothetical protein GCM10007231_14390 [Nocardioides daphniae]